MKNIRLILILTAVAAGLHLQPLRAQTPIPAPGAAPQPNAETMAREKAAAEAAVAKAAAAATNRVRALPTPVGGAAPGATRAAPPALPAFPAPPAIGAANPAAAGANTNRTGIQFTPRTPAVIPTAPAAPQPGVTTGTGAAPTNLTPAALRAAVAAAAANPANPADAAAAQPEEVFPPGLLKFVEADITPILEIYQELTGRTVFRSPSLPPAKITFKTQTPLTRTEAIHALDTILSMNNISMVPQGTKFVKAVAQATAGTEGAQFNDLPPELLAESGTIITHVVQLSNALPSEVQQIIQPFAKLPASIIAIPSTSMIVLRDNSENVKRMLEMIAKVDVVPVQEFESVVIPIKYALAEDVASVLSQVTQGGGGGGGGTTSSARTGTGGSAFNSRFSNAGVGANAGPGSPGYNPANPYGGAAGGAGGFGSGFGGGGAGGVGGARNSFAGRLNQIVNRAAGGGGGDIFVLSQSKIIPDPRINALLVFASKADLITISNIIDKVDVVLAQVLIEAIIMEVKVGNNLNYGFSYLQKNPATIGSVASGIGAINNGAFLKPGDFLNLGTNATGGLPGGFSYAASFMNFDATLTAMASDSRVNIISRPRIQTSHAVPANLFIGQTRPYVTGTSYGYGGFGGGSPQTQFQQQQIGITLQVLPLINAEGLVIMDIGIKVQNIGELIPIDATFSVPETIDRQAEAKVAVRDRDTIMLGGFISKQRNLSKSGVPILKDIPIIGALFRSSKDDDSRTELITLIRPTVLPSPKDASLVAIEEKNKMPTVRTIEREYKEDERKRMEFEDRKEKSSKTGEKSLYKREGFSR